MAENEKKYPQYSEFKGNSVINLSQFFSFGLSKAKLIVEHYPAILKFVETEASKQKINPNSPEHTPAPEKKAD
jgi:hypothetical protein